LGDINNRLGNGESKKGVQRILDLFDTEGTGRITLKILTRVAREL